MLLWSSLLQNEVSKKKEESLSLSDQRKMQDSKRSPLEAHYMTLIMECDQKAPQIFTVAETISTVLITLESELLKWISNNHWRAMSLDSWGMQRLFAIQKQISTVGKYSK